ncbi:Myb-like_DNA-binding domain containing protein [Hexamita inflata]|uniref:Myb-like DNA-binding domain containing protein n=1 Tax=Hexamita inflata TaxID=28002 RepID=A0AA86PW14_9EUKA|nr:Myb-like DNA-binding domain containing protein [Hexamita inflata]
MQTLQERQINKQNYTRDNVKCIPWTQKQLNLLLEVAEQLKRDWKLISNLYFPDRNANQLKCKYNYAKRTSQQKHNTFHNLNSYNKSNLSEQLQQIEVYHNTDTEHSIQDLWYDMDYM